jgi:hypothetical protein
MDSVGHFDRRARSMGRVQGPPVGQGSGGERAEWLDILGAVIAAVLPRSRVPEGDGLTRLEFAVPGHLNGREVGEDGPLDFWRDEAPHPSEEYQSCTVPVASLTAGGVYVMSTS